MEGASKYGTLLVGGITLIGGAFLGKLAVDAIQGDEVTAPGERSAFDDSVRLVASLVGISVTLLQLPAAWEQGKALMADIEKGTLPAP